MTAPETSSPTDRWLAAGDLPALHGAADVADRLLLLVHYGIDWQNGWLSNARHRIKYWDPILPDRVILATFSAGTLRRWYTDVAAQLISAPRNAAERRELEQLLRPAVAETQVLEVLRTETAGLLLRIRITADAVRDARPATAKES